MPPPSSSSTDTGLITSDDASRMLGVSRATLYSYVSRGFIDSIRSPDGKTSLFRLDQLRELAAKGRPRQRASRRTPTIRIVTAITRLDESDLSYRNQRVVDLMGNASFENVAHLLWNVSDDAGPDRTHSTVDWSADRRALTALASIDPNGKLTAAERVRIVTSVAAAVGLGMPTDSHGGGLPDRYTSIAAAGRTIIATACNAIGPRPSEDETDGGDRSIAERLTTSLSTASRDAISPNWSSLVDAALVSMADHEFATSTFAVRVAASVRADPFECVLAGMATMSGRLHGGASTEAMHLLASATPNSRPAGVNGTTVDYREWAAAVVSDAQSRRHRVPDHRVPGFGHTIYKRSDPRFVRLFEMMERRPECADTCARIRAITDAVNDAFEVPPNIDLALGGLCVAADFPVGSGEAIATIARIAGWLAHTNEEYQEAPLRFRSRGIYAGRTEFETGALH